MKIIIPNNCPSCSSILENINGQLFCKNSSTCSAQSSKTVENYCKKMKIKGFGAKTIDKLEFTTVSDLYTTTEQRLTELLDSEKMGSKLFTEINKSKSSEFSAVLGSLGIKLIGKVAAEKLATRINSFEDITPTNCKAAGLGEKAIEALLDWTGSEEGLDTISVLNANITFNEKSIALVEQKALSVMDVCVTGKLNDFTSRSKAADYLSQFGITVKNSVTKTVKYLVCEDDSKMGSSSYKKAIASNIPIVTIKELLEK